MSTADDEQDTLLQIHQGGLRRRWGQSWTNGPCSCLPCTCIFKSNLTQSSKLCFSKGIVSEAENLPWAKCLVEAVIQTTCSLGRSNPVRFTPLKKENEEQKRARKDSF